MLDLFGEKPRRPRRVLMHVIDAGDNCGDEHFDVVCKFGCSTCGTETDWLLVGNVTTAKRGIPCETCNAVATNQRGEDENG